MDQVEQSMPVTDVLNKVNVTAEVRLLLEVFVRVYFKKPELQHAIKFLVGSKSVEASAFQLKSPTEKKLYGSGKHRSVDYWKRLSKILAHREFFSCTLGHQNVENSSLLASDQKLFEEHMRLTMKAQQFFISRLEELIVDASELSCEEVLLVPELPENMDVQEYPNESQSQEVTFIGQVASIPKKRLRTIRQQQYKAFPIMSEAPTSFPTDIALSDFEIELKEALQKISDPHKKVMVKMLEPLGDYEIYFIHAFFFYTTVMIGQHKIVHVDHVSDLLAECVKLGFPLHLSSLEIDYKMIEEVHNKVKVFGGLVSDPKLFLERLPKGQIDLNRLKIVLAILEFEYGLEQEEDGATSNSKKREGEKNEVSLVKTCAAELDQSLSFNTNQIQCMMVMQHESVTAETTQTIIPGCGAVVRSRILPYHDPATKKIRVNDEEY